jgi:cytochrome P450
VEIGGYLLPAGSLVALYTYVVHRDPRFWPDPERFDPGRFTPEQKAARPKFAYFPFGGGARQCIGEPFAWMEGVLMLATIAQRFRLRLVPGHRVVPQALITLRPRYGMRMVAEERHPSR